MSWTRSIGIDEEVCSTGIVPEPSVGSFSSELPGWQSTKYSPISDCGRISQLASLRKSSRPGSVILAVTTALGGLPFFFSISKSLVEPAVTPPTRKSPPSTRPKALSKTILYSRPVESSDAPVRTTAANSAARTSATEATRLTGPPAQPPARTPQHCSASRSAWLRTFEPSAAASSDAARAALVLLLPGRTEPWQVLVERDEAASDGAERVEAATRGREVVEPADEVVRVGARQRDLGRALLECVHRLLEGAAASRRR